MPFDIVNILKPSLLIAHVTDTFYNQINSIKRGKGKMSGPVVGRYPFTFYFC
jgi:hypothetical protein